MEPAWYFLTRATATLIPLILAAFGAGLWMGWIKWHPWKREYSEVEKDYHKLHDIHDVARATIPELEARRKALTDEIDGLEGLLGRYQDANAKYEAESRRLNEALRAQKRNFDALEDIWRNKLSLAEARIADLERSLGREPTARTAPVAAPAPAAVATPVAASAPAIHRPEPVMEMETAPDKTETSRLIPFPELTLEAEPARTTTASVSAPAAAAAPRPGKTKKRRAV